MNNKVTQSIEVIGPQGQEFRVESYKLFGDHWLQTSRTIKGISQDFKTKRYTSKDEMFRHRALCHDYLKEKGIW